MTTQPITAEITLTKVAGEVVASVNGEQVARTADTNNFIRRIDAAMRRVGVYRQTGYEYVAGTFVANGIMVAA